jgi:ankyrin repeat protein/tRNA A-37 threonylcarbamoyl transferase component Bud32
MAGAIALSPIAEAPHPAFGRPLRYFGDYELIDEIARGGMGVVYKARQISLNRTVAVKMILTGRRPMAAEVNRFRASTRAAAGLQHPNIVPIYEIGEQDGHDYFSMEFVEGPNLAQVVRDNPLPAARAASYVRTIAEAVHYAHDRGVLHRDLKPSNILLDSLDQPRVTDFGLAKNLSSDPELTEAGQVLGAPSFIPPEQAAGLTDEVGRHSDVYALGGILYYLLTGHPPFAAETPLATIARVLHHDPVPPRKLNANIPQRLENICLKCLEKRPQCRYPTAKELADELGRFQRNEPIHAGDRARRNGMGRPWYQRNAVIAGSVSTIVLLLIGGLMYWRTRLPDTSARDTAHTLGQTKEALPQVVSSLQSTGGTTNNPTQSGQLEIADHAMARLHPQADKSPPPLDSSAHTVIGDIHDAAKSGDIDRVKALLQSNPHLISSKTPEGLTPLHEAALYGRKDVVVLLLERKAEINSTDNGGGTALHYAAMNGHKDIVELLLTGNAEVNANNLDGDTPLDYAAMKDRSDIIKRLLANNADVNVTDKLGADALHFAAQEGHTDVVELLLANNAEVNAKNNKGQTPLQLAAKNGYKNVAELLLAKKADANASDIHGGTPLHYAAATGHKDVVELLLVNKADANILDNNGSTPLALAERLGQKDVAETLRLRGVNK